MTKLYKCACALTGCALLLFLHFYRLDAIPGLHFDEAWAMNFSWRIASEKGFWPLAAMSPYTAPWTHYWAALWLHILGPSLLVFRGSQVCLSLLGLAATCFALPKHVRAVFPWAVLLLPGLVFNHRFAIELNGFHVLCFGLLAWGIRKEKIWLACAAALAGTTAHILFYAVALALCSAVVLEGVALSTRARRGAMLYFALIAIFFARVTLSIPEKAKGGALAASALLALAIFFFEGERFWKKPFLPVLVAVGSIIYVFNALFFSLGLWGVSISTGVSLQDSLPVFLLFFPAAAGLLIVFYTSTKEVPRFVMKGFLSLALFSGIMMLKPAPRYFELTMLTLAAMLCWNLWNWIYLWEWPPGKSAPKITFLAFCLLAIAPGISYPLYKLIPPIDREFHFLFFKDSSRDFLDKQSLAHHLGGSGCSLSDIHSSDPRLMEELQALSLGDWPVDSSKPCAFNVAQRASEAGAVGERFGEFVLRRKR